MPALEIALLTTTSEDQAAAAPAAAHFSPTPRAEHAGKLANRRLAVSPALIDYFAEPANQAVQTMKRRSFSAATYAATALAALVVLRQPRVSDAHNLGLSSTHALSSWSKTSSPTSQRLPLNF